MEEANTALAVQQYLDELVEVEGNTFAQMNGSMH